VLPQPALVAPFTGTRRAPVPILHVQHLSLDSGRPLLSTDDGEPLQPPPRPLSPPLPPPLSNEAGPPADVPPADVPFEWVTRGLPPLPPKNTTLCSPRFEWVPGRLECSSTPHPSLSAEHAHGRRSQLPLPWPATTSSSMLPPSYDTARVTLAAGAERQTLAELGMNPDLPSSRARPARLLPSHPSVGPMTSVEYF